ncbi:hypothetical protein ID875_02460 [Streptomyces globisporus]|uniref:Uncharacterized protein n=1 Tax=Streptomyces globisporus TaxID=1908 RepID=A0A927BH65_STRGL|nr:hypothetical protein [Streptomyces globisporus]
MNSASGWLIAWTICPAIVLSCSTLGRVTTAREPPAVSTARIGFAGSTRTFTK